MELGIKHIVILYATTGSTANLIMNKFKKISRIIFHHVGAQISILMNKIFRRTKHRFISNFDTMIHVIILIKNFGQESTMVFK